MGDVENFLFQGIDSFGNVRDIYFNLFLTKVLQSFSDENLQLRQGFDVVIAVGGQDALPEFLKNFLPVCFRIDIRMDQFGKPPVQGSRPLDFIAGGGESRPACV